GATTLRVWLTTHDDNTISMAVADTTGQPVASIDSLAFREVSPDHLATAPSDYHRSLFGVDWGELPMTSAPVPARWAVLGGGGAGLSAALADVAGGVEVFADLAGLSESVAAGGPAPEVVVYTVDSGAAWATDVAAAVREVTGQVLGVLREWLGGQRLAGPRVVGLARAARAAPRRDSPP